MIFLKLIWFYPIPFAPQQIKTSFFCIRLVEIWNFARLFVPLNCVRRYFRSEILKLIWNFARLFVPLQPIF